MKKTDTKKAPRPKPGEKPSITVSVFGCSALENPDATLSAEECEAMAKAWSRAALAIRMREYGEVIANDIDGDDMLCVTLDYDSIEHDAKQGYPTIARFPTLVRRGGRAKKRAA